MRKLKVALFALLLVALVGVWQGIVFWFRHGYSVGTRTGVIRKISVKGPPYCKYLAGELALQSATPTQTVEVWEFTVDDDHDTNPLVADLHTAEKAARPVTLKYRQDLKVWWRCNPSEYYVTGVER
jgi:hypothetical protein